MKKEKVKRELATVESEIIEKKDEIVEQSTDESEIIEKKDEIVEQSTDESEIIEKKDEIVEQSTDVVQVETLISLAIKNNVSVEALEKVVAMRRELRAEQAKEMFDSAMANFQGACPVIEKTKAGGKTKSGQVAYYYAPLDVIVSQVKELLQSFGLSYAINTKTLEGNKVYVVCIVKHIAGHSEISEIEMPLGQQTGVMSAPQVVAAALTFAKRYAFVNAFGILTGDEDNDAQQPTQQYQPKTSQPTHVKAVEVTPLATQEQKQQINTLMTGMGSTVDKLVEAGSIPPLDKLNATQANKAIQDLTQLAKIRKEQALDIITPATCSRIRSMADTEGLTDDAGIIEYLDTKHGIQIKDIKTITEAQGKHIIMKMTADRAEKTGEVKSKDGELICEKCGMPLNKIEIKSLEKRGEFDVFIDGGINQYKVLCAKCQIALGYV